MVEFKPVYVGGINRRGHGKCEVYLTFDHVENFESTYKALLAEGVSISIDFREQSITIISADSV